MAGIWCMYGNWGKTGHCHFQDPDLVYLYIVSDIGFPIDHLFCSRILDEYQKVHSFGEKKSPEVSVSFRI